MRHSRVARALLIGAVVASQTASADIVVLEASQDNTLYENTPGTVSNGAGQFFFTGRTVQVLNSIRRGLVAFDIAGQIPAGSVIQNVELTLRMSRTLDLTDRTVELRRLAADWGEGTSDAPLQEGGGTAATPGDATWFHTFFDTDSWATAGGDFSATASASANVGGLGFYTWGSTPEMVADAQAWLDIPADNFGWIILGDESVSGTSRRFDSRENGTPANEPMLTVEFTPPGMGACCEPVSGTCTADVTEIECDVLGGTYGGDGSDCSTVAPPCEPAIAIELQLVADGLTSPLTVTHTGDGSGRLFIVDQSGVIRIVKDGILLPDPFLDITDIMVTLDSFFDERGLLGLAFHPDYANNDRFYIRYSTPRAGMMGEPCFGTSRGCHTEVLSEFLVTADPDIADASSESVLFTIDEPQFNHDSGHVAFGPDGFLYFSLGDGGGAHDGLADSPPSHGPTGNGQNIETALGSVLRIDVDSAPEPGLEYAIPSDNPFVGVTGVDEIYAYGFRNPYRFSFDDGPGGDGSLYVADVGQNLFEEVDIVTKGGNYGWVFKEGFNCFDPFSPTAPPLTCDESGLIDPVSEYSHEEGGTAIVGGHVYRGAAYPTLAGQYVYGDFTADFFAPSGRLYYFETTGPNAYQRREFFLAPDGEPFGHYLLGFGENEDGEVYVCASDSLAPAGNTGLVYRMTAPAAGATGVSPRYLEITPPPGPAPIRLLVEADCVDGPAKYVGNPSGPDNAAELVNNPASAAALTPAQWGEKVRVTGIDVVPQTDYKVHVDTGMLGSSALSAPAVAATSKWGDVVGDFDGMEWTPPDGTTDFLDISSVVDAFKNDLDAPAVFRADLVGPSGSECRPDQGIDFLDITGAVDAFRGFGYTVLCPDACP